MQLTSVLSSMDPHDDDAASVVTVTKTVVVSHVERIFTMSQGEG